MVAPIARADGFARQMVLQSSESGYTDVILDERLTPWPESGEQAAFKFEGGGWIKQAWLWGLDPIAENMYVSIWWTRVEGESSLGAFSFDWALLANSDHLPAGRYRWYLMTNNDTPATATMSWPTRSGSSDLRPEVPLPLTEKPLLVKTLGSLSWFGQTTSDMGPQGAAFLLLNTRSGTPSADRIETCTYLGGDGGRRDAYMPDCPGGDGWASTSVPHDGEDLVSSWFGDGGKLGVGGNLTVAGVPPVYDVRAAWMPLQRAGDPGWPSVPTGAPPPGTEAGPTTVTTGPQVESREQAAAEPRPALSRAVLLTRRARPQRGRASLRLRCAGEETCRGQVRIGGARARAFRVRAGRSAVVSVPLARHISRVLQRRRSLLARVVVITQAPASMLRESRRIRLVR